MSMVITAGAKPAFLSPNRMTRYADKGSDLAVSTGSAVRHRLYDNDPKAQYTSAGANDDATSEIITAGIWQPGAQLSTDIDFWAVLNHNIATLVVERSNDNGATWTTVASLSGVTDDYSRGVYTTAASDKFRFTATATQTADQEKLIGAIYLASLRFQATRMPLMMKPLPPRIGAKTAVMADGSIRWAPVFRSDASFMHQDYDLEFLVDTSAELENFRDMARDYEPFLFMPRPGDKPSDILLCRIRPGSYSETPLVRANLDALRVSLIAEEVGAS